MTELLVGTKKGLFVLEGEPGARFEVKARAFAGSRSNTPCATLAPAALRVRQPSRSTGRRSSSRTIPSGEWRQAEGVVLPEGGDAALERIWTIVPGERDGMFYAGGDPGVLFESRDGGETWALNRRSGSTRAGRRGSRAGAGSAFTRSCRGRATRTGSRSRSRPRAFS